MLPLQTLSSSMMPNAWRSWISVTLLDARNASYHAYCANDGCNRTETSSPPASMLMKPGSGFAAAAVLLFVLVVCGVLVAPSACPSLMLSMLRRLSEKWQPCLRFLLSGNLSRDAWFRRTSSMLGYWCCAQTAARMRLLLWCMARL